MSPVSDRKPAMSVVIPTYNWSAALRCAIRSVLLQTISDFEILVVGDGCTDDSEEVVASFADGRLRWHNLPRNYGSQWAANNYALEHAAAEWVAYLGHDDIWYPTHLERVLEVAQHEAADVVTSTMILYGPPRSGVRGLAGVFASGGFRAGDFVPPSAFAHRTALAGEMISWRDPQTVALPMDAAFLNEFAIDDRRFVSTRELTSFKFNAAWRRDSYQLRSVAEQEQMLERIEAGVDFRQTELLDVLQAVAAGLFVPIEAPSTAGIEEGLFVRRNRRFKGLDSRFPNTQLAQIERSTEFDMSGQEMPFEWHPLELQLDGTSFRWSGPSPRATIDLPVALDRDLAVRIQVVHVIAPELLDSIKLSFHEMPLDFTVARIDGRIALEVELLKNITQSVRAFAITIDTGQVKRPIDLGVNQDRRWLGIAISSIELRPLAA